MVVVVMKVRVVGLVVGRVVGWGWEFRHREKGDEWCVYAFYVVLVVFQCVCVIICCYCSHGFFVLCLLSWEASNALLFQSYTSIRRRLGWRI